MKFFCQTVAMSLALLLGLVVGSESAVAGKFNRTVDLGDAAPQWSDLPGTDGKQYSLKDFADAKYIVQVFTCNHCPCALACEDRLKSIQKKYGPRGVQVVAMNINGGPLDTMAQMQKRAKERGFNFPYLRDESQAVGAAYGASNTPHVFVLGPDRKIAYMGTIDDSVQDPSNVKKPYLLDALDALLAGQQPRLAETRPVGCSIVYEE